VFNPKSILVQGYNTQGVDVKYLSHLLDRGREGIKKGVKKKLKIYIKRKK
jgi:hypothetical protein